MIKLLIYIFIFFSNCFSQTVRIPLVEFSPMKYVCYKIEDNISIDGKLDEIEWSKAEWSTNFVDIRGKIKPKPQFQTKVKMLWDKKYFYIGVELEESDIWATFTTKDDMLYEENNFEVFIDPDGDTHMYCELEINALNTIWDLLLIKPYRDMKQPSISAWDIKGLKTKISYYGTINNPNDTDSCWIIEIAIPWDIFKELTTKAVPPKNNEQWRVNFARAEWTIDKSNDFYEKWIDLITKRTKTNFSVWSPQGLFNMHYPEMWGYVQFSDIIVGENKIDFIEKENEKAKWFLRQIYYKERIYYKENNKYTADLEILGIKNKSVAGYITPPIIECTSNMFEVTLIKKDRKTKISIKNDGLVYCGKNIDIK